MFALASPWDGSARGSSETLSKRLGSSLCAGIGGHVGHLQIETITLAYRALRWTEGEARAWRPARLPNGKIIVFHGYLDNASSLAGDLGCSSRDFASLYGLAVEKWGAEADRRIIGDYCAVIADLENHRLRLSRSPLRGPPYIMLVLGLAAVASVPRALLASGHRAPVERTISGRQRTAQLERSRGELVLGRLSSSDWSDRRN